jgi:outer membrane protein insertion porin family
MTLFTYLIDGFLRGIKNMKKIFAALTIFLSVTAVEARADSAYVKSIEVEGIERVERDTILSYLDVKPGENVSQEKLDEALKRIYATGLFTDIGFDITESGVLIVKVAENPIINKRVFDGNKKIDDNILESEVRLAPRSIYSRAKVQEDVQRILEVYKRSGRYAAVVEPKIIKRDQNRVDLVFEIDEGPLAKVSKLNFVGNTHYSDDDLSTEIMTKESRWYRIFSSSENYDPDKTNYDKELLRRFYLKRGYADFRVVSSVAELTPDKTSFVLTFVLDEGKRYKVSEVEIISKMAEVDPSLYYEFVELQKGDRYNAELVEKSVYAITEELGKKGFAFVNVEPDLEKNVSKAKLKVVFAIKEGERVFIDRINIKGNTRTREDVIRREFRIDEGDAFNASKLRASRRNVENLNYFSKVDIETIPSDDGNKADIDVNVEEKSTGYFNVGIGYSTVNGALFRAGVTENNFRGLGQQLGLDMSISQKYSEYQASFTEPYLFGRRLSGGVDVFKTEQDYQDEGSYDEESYGLRFRLGWNYTDDLSHYARYTIRRDEITDVDPFASQYIKDEEGKYTGSVIGQTLVYDKRDSKYNTKEGYYLSFGHDVAGLGGDEKYLKFDVKAHKYFTIADYYTLKFFANAGYMDAYSDERIRLSQRYYLGGNTMRGFDVAGIGARDKYTKDALGGNWMVYSGAEMTFPIGLDELGVKGRTFLDIGMLGKPDNIDRNYVDYDSSPRVSVGAGVQWQSPMGQIDIDFGFPIVKEDYDETEVFRLNFGTSL